MILNLWIAGAPKAQPRVRAFARGRHARVYTPDTADAWKQAVVLALRAETWEPFAGAVGVSLDFVLPRPQRLKDRLMVWHTAKPDADNLAKAVLDACSQAELWSDDAQVAHLAASKRYANPGQETGCWLSVRTLLA